MSTWFNSVFFRHLEIDTGVCMCGLVVWLLKNREKKLFFKNLQKKESVCVHFFCKRKKMKLDDELSTLLEEIETITLTRSQEHKTLYRCDICAELTDQCGNGGCCMSELDGSTTFACSKCMKEYCEIPADDRTRKYSIELTPKQRVDIIFSKTPEQYRKVAYYAKIGMDPTAIALMTRFPASVPFSYSKALMHCIDRICGNDTVAVSLLDTRTNVVTIKYIAREDAHSANIGFVSIHRCWRCAKVSTIDIRCRVCDFANYCSKKCMVKHREMHRDCCEYVVKKIATMFGRKQSEEVTECQPRSRCRCSRLKKKRAKRNN
jgi:hypothetical protein